MHHIQKKEELILKQIVFVNYDLFFMPEKSQGIIFSVYAVILQNMMNISQSFLYDQPPILDYHQNLFL